MSVKRALPPPIFKYDPANMPELYEKIKRYDDYAELPANLELRQTICAPDAILELPNVLQALAPGTREVILVMDQTPMKRGTDSLKPMVREMLAAAGYAIDLVEIEGDKHGVVHPDFINVDYVKSRIRPGVPVATVGSGVVSDITKHASFLFDEAHPDISPVPLVFCQTASAVPAYASRMAIISKGNVKRTWPSRLPNVIIQDIKTLCDCPLEYSLGGIGDMCAMFPGFADWYLGTYFGMTHYQQASWEILEDVKDLMFAYAEEIGKRTPVGMEVLAKIQTLGGLTMTFARDSSPVSGYEHVVSHMLDMSAEHYDRPIGNHGSQCAVAGIPTLIGMGWLLDNLDPAKVDIDRCYPSYEVMEERVRAAFAEIDPTGASGAECWSDYKKKLDGWYLARPQFEQFLADWDSQKAHLESLMLRVEPYVRSLNASGHPMLFDELNVPIPEDQARWAYHNAHLMRKRFFASDIVYFMGWFDEGWTDRVFARMHELVDDARKASPSLVSA
jgi:glycerol-1-phosphate dehydrogenase [NAD(P)+]